MASATNVENLAHAGLGEFEVRPNDLVVAVSGTEEACAEALQKADELLSAKASGGGEEEAAAHAAVTSIQMAVARDPAHNFALISVPGDYAAAEAMKALRLGMDVMLFSDNVPPESELALKTYARDHDLMVMGPDCGTAIVNGVPLGFANVVRRGPIGVVGASGTGTQEVTVRIHQLGAGSVAGAWHRRPRPVRADRRDLDAARAARARRRPRHEGHRAGIETTCAGDRGTRTGRGRGQRQAGGGDLPRRRPGLDHTQRRVRGELPRAGRRHGGRPCEGRRGRRNSRCHLERNAAHA